jgi:hypothetical protein
MMFEFAMADLPAFHGFIPGKAVDARPARAGHGDVLDHSLDRVS